MAKALKFFQHVWQWLAERGADRALSDKHLAEYIEQRRRDAVRRTAARMGSY
jgi:hypothetical protein